MDARSDGQGAHGASHPLPPADFPLVSRTIPNYLKLHVEELAAARAASATPQDPLSESFAAATGWQLPAPRAAVKRPRAARRLESESLVLEPVPSQDGPPPVDAHRARPLVRAIHQLVADLEKARQTVEEREAELATAIPISMPRDEANPLVRRLGILLRTAADSVQAEAAGLYLLDDSTSHLKLRAHYGLGPSRFFAPARGLRGQAADLEALLGRCIIIPETTGSPYERSIPEACGAAICVPISSPSMPLGTLWVFASSPRDFSPLQRNFVEVVAGRIASELERHALCRETLQLSQMQRQWRDATRWLRRRVPLTEPLAQGWDVGGWTPQLEQLSGQFLDWELLPDERIVVSLGRSPGVALEAGLASITLQSLVKALTPRLRGPRQVLTHVHQTGWRIASGAPLGALAQASILPDSGEVEWSATGQVAGVVVRDKSHRILPCGHDLLGESADAAFRQEKWTLARGESLVLLGTSVASENIPAASGDSAEPSRLTLPATTRAPAVTPAHFAINAQDLAEVVREQAARGVDRLVDGLRRLAELSGNERSEPAALLVIHRRSTP